MVAQVLILDMVLTAIEGVQKLFPRTDARPARLNRKRCRPLRSGLAQPSRQRDAQNRRDQNLHGRCHRDPSRGKPNYSVDDFNRIIQMMDRRGWQIMVHALGDGAVRMTLDGYERLAQVNPEPCPRTPQSSGAY